MSRIRFSRGAVLAPVIAIVGFSGCGVKQGDMDAELARIRSEMQAGDQALADRMDRTDREVASMAGLSDRIQRLEGGLETMREEFGGQIEQLQAAIRFNSPVHFGYDSDQVRAEDRAVLNRFASVVSEYYPMATITVEGFADPAGDATYNINLGLRRADAVKQYLASNGLSAARIRTVSYGEARNRQINPGAFGDRGMANRRVALVVDYTGGAGTPMAVRDEG